MIARYDFDLSAHAMPLPDGKFVTYADHVQALKEERERCAKIAEDEPELEGEPEAYQLEVMREVGLVASLRAAVVATKKNIAAAIRGQHE
jgi:hypothetical protein